MPRVSVIIPAYNYEKFVGEAIQSVLLQTFTDLEVIVVDDGSTDRTRNVVQAFDDPRVHYIYQENRGLPSARNTGIRAASGDYIAFLDADDLWLPEKLEKQLPLLENYPEVGLVYGGYFVIDERGQILATRYPPKIHGDLLYHLLRANRCGSPSTAIIRRECLEFAGLFDETLIACEDWDLWLRIARRFNFASVEQPLAKIRLHGGNMSMDPRRMEVGLFAVLNKFFMEPDLPDSIRTLKPKAMAGAHFEAARFYARSGYLREALVHIIRAIKLDPTWLDPYIMLVRFLVDLALPASGR